MLTFAGSINATPGAVFPANARGGANQLEAPGTHEMDLVSDKGLGAELGSVRWGFQRGAGSGSWGRESEREGNASHMWRKPADILWHSPPGDIHVSLGSRHISGEGLA